MTKVMHFIHGLNTGGAETVVKNYLLNFDRNRFDIILLCLGHRKESPYEETLRRDGVRMFFVEDYLLFRNGGPLSKVFNHFYRYIIVRRIIRTERPDVLHTHLLLNVFVKFARPRKGTKIFHTVHSEPMELWNKRIVRQQDFRAAKWLVKRYNMKFIVLHSKMRDEINRLFGVNDSIVLNNGINLECFKGLKEKDKIREDLGIPVDAFVIGHVGRFSAVKNHRFLLEVFKYIKEKNRKAFLLAVGDGPEKNKIAGLLSRQNLDADSLILSNRDDISSLMKAMDVFVFPSKYEGLGIVVIEAQVSKLPCFVSDKVPPDVVISNLVSELELSRGPEWWGQAILEYRKPQKVIVKGEGWDIVKVVRQLEELYLGKN